MATRMDAVVHRAKVDGVLSYATAADDGGRHILVVSFV